MAWKEMAGTRRVEDNKPHHIDYIITFTAPTAETIPAAGCLIGAITTGNLPTTGVDSEPEAVQISEVVLATPTKAHVTVRFRALYAA